MPSRRGKAKGVRMIDEINKLHKQGLNKSQVARAVGVSRNTVAKYLKSQGVANLKSVYAAPWSERINWQDVEEQTNRGVKLSHYWEEHVEASGAVTYISFWREFKRRFPHIPIEMHKVYEPALRCEFDFKGRDKEFGFYDRETGEFIVCRLFGNILCFSQLLFVRATLSERQADVFDALARSYEYFGGVPETTVFDNAKAQVVRADYFDADLNPEFSYFSEMYGTAPLATRPSSPKDKNLIENALGVFCRWAYPKLSQLRFYSLSELNSEVRRLCDLFNDRIQRKYGLSRRDKFTKNEQPKLKALPETRYQSGEWRRHKPHADSHIQYHYNFYSVPHECRGKEVDVRVSGGTIEIYQDQKRIAIHGLVFGHSRGRYVTNPMHLPDQHRAIAEAIPRAILEESRSVGPHTFQVVRRLLEESTHPLMYLRRCQGLLRLKKRYSCQQLEQACDFFRDMGLRDIKVANVEKVIQVSRQREPAKRVQRSQNENLRGQSHWGEYFH